MKNASTPALIVALAVCLIPVRRSLAQVSDAPAPAFEVASLKLSGPIEPLRARLLARMAEEGHSGSLPGRGLRIDIHGMTAAELVAAAYRIPLREVEGPGWISDVRFDIEALIPADPGRNKAPEMLLTLLQERLALKAHPEVRRTSGYILSVGKAGPKFKEAPPFTPSAEMGSLTNRSGPRFAGLRENLGHCDMSQLANDLAINLKAPVEDRTGLKGFYTLEILIPAEDMKDEAQRPGAFQQAMKAYGLNLAGGKIDVPILVIDKLSKVPAPN